MAEDTSPPADFDFYKQLGEDLLESTDGLADAIRKHLSELGEKLAAHASTAVESVTAKGVPVVSELLGDVADGLIEAGWKVFDIAQAIVDREAESEAQAPVSDKDDS